MHFESISQHNNYSRTKPIGFKDLETCKIYSFGCTRRIDKQFAEEKRKFISDKLNQIDFQFGNYSDEESKESRRTLYNVHQQIFNTENTSKVSN
jgi:hypothetical protein